jgi:hypothetical protein
MVGLAPGLGPVRGRSWPIARARVAVAFLLARLLEHVRRCSRVMTRELEMRVLDGVNERSLASLGWESFAWVRSTGFANGGLPMGSILGSAHW